MSQVQKTQFVWRAYKYKGTLYTLELIEKLFDIGPYSAQLKLMELTKILLKFYKDTKGL